MMKIISVLILLTILFLLIANLRLEGEILFRKEGKDDLFMFKLKLANFTLYKLIVPSISNRGDLLEIPIELLGRWGILKEQTLLKTPNSISFVKFLIKSLPNSAKETKKILNKIQFRKWIWSTKIGGPDPATTGIITGVSWYLKHFFYRRLILYTGFSNFQPEFNVIPNFKEQLFDMEFHCIFTFKAGHIITTAFQISRYIFLFFIRR